MKDSLTAELTGLNKRNILEKRADNKNNKIN
jgi:hypothetical protein